MFDELCPLSSERLDLRTETRIMKVCRTKAKLTICHLGTQYVVLMCLLGSMAHGQSISNLPKTEIPEMRSASVNT